MEVVDGGEPTQLELNKFLQDICSVVNSSRAEILSCMYRGGDPFADESTALISLCKRERFDIIREIVVEKKDVLKYNTIGDIGPLISELCTHYKNGRSNVYEILLLFEQYGLFGDWNRAEWAHDALWCLATARRKKIGYMEERLGDINSEEEKYMKIVRELREEKGTIRKEIKELKGLLK